MIVLAMVVLGIVFIVGIYFSCKVSKPMKKLPKAKKVPMPVEVEKTKQV